MPLKSCLVHLCSDLFNMRYSGQIEASQGKELTACCARLYKHLLCDNVEDYARSLHRYVQRHICVIHLGDCSMDKRHALKERHAHAKRLQLLYGARVVPDRMLQLFGLNFTDGTMEVVAHSSETADKVGMGGGRNGCFWGAPIFHVFVENWCIFQGFGQNWGAPKTAVPTAAHPIPHLTPLRFSRRFAIFGALRTSVSWPSGSCLIMQRIENPSRVKTRRLRFSSSLSDTVTPRLAIQPTC